MTHSERPKIRIIPALKGSIGLFISPQLLVLWLLLVIYFVIMGLIIGSHNRVCSFIMLVKSAMIRSVASVSLTFLLIEAINCSAIVMTTVLSTTNLVFSIKLMAGGYEFLDLHNQIANLA